MSRSDPAFRVIVVGAGVAGLTASHCLQKAGIDHILLERRPEVAPPEGASIAIYPHGARILQQIGCLESAKRASVPCNRWYCRRPNGRAIMDNGFFKYCREKYVAHLPNFFALNGLRTKVVFTVMAKTSSCLRDAAFSRYSTTTSQTRNSSG